MAVSLNSTPLTIRARPIVLFVLSSIFAGLWLGQIAGIYAIIEFQGQPDNQLLSWLLIPFGLFFFVAGLFHTSRTLTIDDGRLIIAHWFRRRQLPLENVAAVSMRYRRLGRSVMRLLELWEHEAELTPLASIDMSGFSQADLQQLIKRLQQECPHVKVDREVVRYIGGGLQA